MFRVTMDSETELKQLNQIFFRNGTRFSPLFATMNWLQNRQDEIVKEQQRERARKRIEKQKKNHIKWNERKFAESHNCAPIVCHWYNILNEQHYRLSPCTRFSFLSFFAFIFTHVIHWHQTIHWSDHTWTNHFIYLNRFLLSNCCKQTK